MSRTARKPRAATITLIEAANNILSQYDHPITLRQLYYRLVAGQVIENRLSAYQKLSVTLTGARDRGDVDPRKIVDHGRVLRRVQCWADLPEFLDAVSRSYRREKHGEQPYHVELWCEKDALTTILAPIADLYEIGFFAARGFSSYTCLLEAADRFRDSGKPPVILYLGDFDPSGMDMRRDIPHRLREQQGVAVDFRAIALTSLQIEEHDLPPDFAKESDTRAASFIAEHGNRSVELDALPPEVLREIVREAIETVVDVDALEVARRRQAEENVALDEIVREITGRLTA